MGLGRVSWLKYMNVILNYIPIVWHVYVYMESFDSEMGGTVYIFNV